MSELFGPAHFPMLKQTMNGKRLAYLDSGATALKPRTVSERVRAYLEDHTSNVHRGVFRLSEENTGAFEAVRDQVRALLNAAAREEIIFTKGTTEAINLVAQSWGRKNLRAGDEILLSGLEHHANIVPWQLLAEEKGAHIKVIPVRDDGSLDRDAFARLLGPRTRVLALSMVSNTLGTVTPYREFTAAARQNGTLVVLDAAQAAPHFKVDVQEIGCDFLAFSGHKTYGPTGVGVLWGRQELLEAMPPWQGGGNMIATVTFEKTTYNKLPEKFEAGTPAVAEVLGLGAALEFMAAVGMDQLAARDHQLRDLAVRELLAIPGVAIYGSAEKIATFAFNVDGVHPQDLGSVLDKEGVAIRTGHHCTQPLMARFGVTAMARASFGPYNTEQDVGQLVGAIQKAQRLFT
jgi:cysteine desulfurase/selenocysteine lyase